MKTVKSVLLGSAAGLVAVTAGQAADLPVKAKPVEYVKVCSLYGAGFYYMPGTDLCIKVGGWSRGEATYGANGNLAWGPFNGNLNLRTTNNLTFRARGYITADVRNQTEYGTVRGYISIGLNTNDSGLQVANLVDSANRAFVQWAGMTAGLSQSFYDFYNAPALQYRAGYVPGSDTGDTGWFVWAYTAQFGGGFSGTISAEARRMTQIIDANCTAALSGTCGTTAPGAYPGTYVAAGGAGGIAAAPIGASGAVAPGTGAYGGFQAPDVIANLRVDQTWGSAQLMGAVHEVNASYYSAAAAGAPSAASLGHPSDAWGWVAGAGIKINAPFITSGDFFQGQVSVTQGALRYLFQATNSNWGKNEGAGGVGGMQAYGVMSDCVYGGSAAAPATQTSCNLTSAWGFNAGYEHFWVPQLHQSLFGGYAQVMYGAQANAMLCSVAGGGNGAGVGSAAVATAGCNNNWSAWGVGSRLQWDVTKTFYLGVEALYQDLHSASIATGATLGGYAAAGSGATVVKSDVSNWAITVRAHRDFLP